MVPVNRTRTICPDPTGTSTSSPTAPCTVEPACSDPSDIMVVSVAATCIATYALVLGRRSGVLSAARRALHLDRPSIPRSALLPLALDLTGNALLAAAFTHWRGYATTLSGAALLMLLLLRMRMEGAFALITFLLVPRIINAPHRMPDSVLQLAPRRLRDRDGWPAGARHAAAELALWAAAASVAAYVYVVGWARGLYEPRVWDALGPHVKQMYVSAGLMMLFVAGLLVVVAWEVRSLFDTWDPEAAKRAERTLAARAGSGAAAPAGAGDAPTETDGLLGAALHAEENQGPIVKDADDQRPRRIAAAIRGFLALFISLGAVMVPLIFWSGFTYHMKGK